MKSRLGLLAVLMLFVSQASGHFVYVLPTGTEPRVQVVFSDLLEPDKKVPIAKIDATELFAVDSEGKQAPLRLEKSDHSLTASLPANRPLVVRGFTNYGIANSRHTGNRPVLLKYYPKALVGQAAMEHSPSAGAPLEVVSLVEENQIRFAAVREGKPLNDATCVVLLPDGSKTEQLKTDSQGRVPGRYAQPGRYGVWVKVVDDVPGEIRGQKYDKTHHYATLVVDLGRGSK